MKQARMQRISGYCRQASHRRRISARMGGIAAMGTMCALAGCINLTAPTEPIVITLNINIEVTAQLVENASEAVEENADIF